MSRRLPMFIVYLVLLLVGAVLVGAQFGLLRGTAPTNLGVREGKLKPPSKTENSVSSQARLWPDHAMQAYADIAPLALLPAGGAATMTRLQAVIAAMPGARIESAQADYVYARFETKVLKFVDDAEFWLDPAGNVVQVRSASRLGRKDFGVNRARIEAIRRALAA
ncbi:MAG: DUF1499 domain-containing protein [Rubrivivax sp.]|jgi:uncharacterized protein (DUF1499 family)